MGTKRACDDPYCLRILEVALSLFGRGCTIRRRSHTYNHNFLNRGVKPVKIHFHIIRPLGIIVPSKKEGFPKWTD
jgi:hypothetical protein